MDGPDIEIQNAVVQDEFDLLLGSIAAFVQHFRQTGSLATGIGLEVGTNVDLAITLACSQTTTVEARLSK